MKKYTPKIPGEKAPPTTAALRLVFKNTNLKHLLSKEETAILLGIPRRTLEEWMASKRIPFLRLSPRMVRFNMERVLAALDRYEVKEAGRRAA